jgi:hypothetical protein
MVMTDTPITSARMSELEKVARAIFEANNWPFWENGLSPQGLDALYREARAAIAAIDEARGWQAMDVDDLARELLAETPLLVGWEQRSETVRVQTWCRIALAYYEAHRIFPLIEAHTRAAVEAERAACEVLVRAVATTCRNHGADKGADALLIAADAIAARRQP